jgi:hypothetical protein
MKTSLVVCWGYQYLKHNLQCFKVSSSFRFRVPSIAGLEVNDILTFFDPKLLLLIIKEEKKGKIYVFISVKDHPNTCRDAGVRDL